MGFPSHIYYFNGEKFPNKMQFILFFFKFFILDCIGLEDQQPKPESDAHVVHIHIQQVADRVETEQRLETKSNRQECVFDTFIL